MEESTKTNFEAERVERPGTQCWETDCSGCNNQSVGIAVLTPVQVFVLRAGD